MKGPSAEAWGGCLSPPLRCVYPPGHAGEPQAFPLCNEEENISHWAMQFQDRRLKWFKILLSWQLKALFRPSPSFSHLLSLIDQSNSVNRQTTFPQPESDFYWQAFCEGVCVYVCEYVCVHVSVCVTASVCICVSVHIVVCMSMCVCLVCLYVYQHTCVLCVHVSVYVSVYVSVL